MSKTLIIGASGNIGKLTTQLLLDKEQQVVALVRDASKMQAFSSPNLEIIEANLEDDFEFAFKNCDTVVFTAGSGGHTDGDKTLLIDLWAAVKSANFAKKHNINHFVMVSSIGTDDPESGPESLQPYLVAKRMADEHLIQSGLEYTILRPASLTDDKGSGLFQTQRPSERSNQVIARENVAQAIQFSLKNDQLKGKIIELFDGDKALSDLL